MNGEFATRPAAVAGRFYPADSAQLRSQLAQLLEQAEAAPLPCPAALIVPHAGYIYSGATAAAGYKQLETCADAFDKVILLGPAHRVPLEGIAVPSASHFRTPLGDVRLNQQAVSAALAVDGVCTSDEAHRLEHSLEVQLPFLQCVLGDFSLLPLVVGQCPVASIAAVIDALWDEPGALLVISSDLSHFEPYDIASAHDLRSCQRILAGASDLSGTDACGAGPINGLMASTRGRGLHPELLAYCNSGDTAGDKNRVVGYASFSLH